MIKRVSSFVRSGSLILYLFSGKEGFHIFVKLYFKIDVLATPSYLVIIQPTTAKRPSGKRNILQIPNAIPRLRGRSNKIQ